jgi:hypothetical protein
VPRVCTTTPKMTELVALHVKYTNMYVARTLSFAKCKFEMTDVKIPDTLKLQYNSVCQVRTGAHTCTRNPTRMHARAQAPAGLLSCHLYHQMFAYLPWGVWCTHCTCVLMYRCIRIRICCLRVTLRCANHFWISVQLLQRMIANDVLEKQEHDKAFPSKFWSSCQRIFAQFIFAAKVDATTQIAEKALREGKCVVIGLGPTLPDNPSCPPFRLPPACKHAQTQTQTRTS